MIKTKNIDIQNLVVDLGICKGDYVMIHADMISLGVIENNAKDLINILLKIVGSNGLILTPSFTFSFSNNKIFDVEKSISKVGSFSKIFSKHKDVKRVPDGMTSFYIIGKHAEDVINKWDNSSFGPGSICGILLDKVKVLQFGTSKLTYVHFVEQLVGVPYRSLKKYSGTINNNGLKYESCTYMYSRTKNVNKVIPDPLRIEFFEKSCVKVRKFAYGEHRVFYAKDYVDFAKEKLSKNNLILIEEVDNE